MDTGETGALGSSRKRLIIMGVHTQSLRCHVSKASCWSWRSTSVCVFSQRTRWTKATSAHWRKEKEEREKKREEGAKEEGGEDLPKTSYRVFWDQIKGIMKGYSKLLWMWLAHSQRFHPSVMVGTSTDWAPLCTGWLLFNRHDWVPTTC